MALTKAEREQLAALQAKAEEVAPKRAKRARGDDREVYILRGNAADSFLSGLFGGSSSSQDDDEDQDDEDDEDEDEDDEEDEPETPADPPAPAGNRFFRKGVRG